MKKAIFILVSFLCSLSIMCGCCSSDQSLNGGSFNDTGDSSSDDTDVDGFLYSVKKDGTLQICGYRGIKNGELSIPFEIYGKKVTEIGAAAFAYAFLENGATKKVTIPATVTEIAEGAFRNCTGLHQIVFKEGSQLDRLGDCAFSGCSGLTSVVLPAGVEQIGSMVFSDCRSLSGTFELPSEMSYCGAGAFLGCDGLTEFALSASNEYYSVSDGVLYDADKTTLYCYPSGKSGSYFVLPDSVKAIRPLAFCGNESLSSVDLANVKTIRERAFADCVNLGTVLSEEANIVEGFAFEGTEWYENNKDFAVIGNVVYSCMGEYTEIDFSGFFSVSPYAAFGNSNIEMITFDNAARNIGAFAFAGCENLDTVYLNNFNSIVYAGTSSFENTADDLTIYLPQRVREEYVGNQLWQQYSDSFAVHTTSLHYNLNGGNIEGESSYVGGVEYGGYLMLPVPEKEGCSFEGWYARSDFSGCALADGKLWDSYFDNVELYAKWIAGAAEYTITYHLNGGSMDFISQTYTEDDVITYPVPEREGYRFIGWYHDKQLSMYAGEGFAAGNKGDLNLFARWEKL